MNTFNCPTCGGPLAYTRGTETTIRCPYCQNTVIIPDELRGGFWLGAFTPADDRARPNIQALPSFDPMQVEKEIRDQLAAGQKINAIKIYRQVTGVGLKQAKEAVEALEAGAPLDASSLTPAVSVSNTAEDDESVIPQATRLVLEGNKIAAIRLLRNHYDLSLKVAKDAAELLERGQTIDIEWLKMKASQAATRYVNPTLEPPNPGARNYFIWICVFGVLLVIIFILMTVVK